MAGFQLSAVEILSSIIFSGACERYPEFKFVLGEAGVGWLPYVLERMDNTYEDRKRQATIHTKPSLIWRQNGNSTFQNEHLTPEIVAAIGEDNIMWGSDYPHMDGVWPNSQSVIEKNLADLDQRTRRKIVCETTASLYRFARDE